MEKSVKNSSPLTDEQRQIVDSIIVIVSARLYSLLEDMDNPENYVQKFLRFASSKEKRSLSYLLFNIKNPCGSDRAFFPSDLNQQLAMVLAKESRHYLKGPALRKVLKVLEDTGTLCNIRGKEDVEDVIGDSFNKQQKGGEYSSSKREGQYSLYKITNDVQKLLDVMSNPIAIQIIHSALKNSGLLTQVLEKALLATLHLLALCDSNKTAENSLLSFLPVFPLYERGDSEKKSLDTQLFANILSSSIKDKTILQKFASHCANVLITEDSILNILYFALAVPRL